MKIHHSPHFLRAAKKLPPALKQQLVAAETLFLQDPFHPKLRTHKLSGKFEGYWSFSINFRYRALFRFITSDEVLLITVGSHSVYQ